MTITIRLKTDNAAFANDQYDTEIRRILREWYQQFDRGRLPLSGDVDTLFDSNGNNVGSVTVKGK